MHTDYSGVYRGTVYSNRDPANQGRLKIQIPQLLAATPTEWAWPVTDEIVQNKLPEVGQGVWVMFEGGNIDFPIWLGVFGKPQTSGSRMYVGSLPSDSYPATIVTSAGFSGKLHLQLIDTLIALANAVNTLETDVSTLQGQVSSLQSDVTDLQTRVTNLEGA